MVTGADTVMASNESLAIAVRVYSPGCTSSHRKRYGAALNAPSLLVPSKNSTLATPSLSEASAWRSRLVGPKKLSWLTGRTNAMTGGGFVTRVSRSARLLVSLASGSPRRTNAVLVIVPGKTAFRVTPMVAWVLSDRVPRSQIKITSALVQAPCEGSAATKVASDEMTLLTTTAEAAPGPELVTVKT